MRYSLHPTPPELLGEPDAVGAYEAKTHLPRLLEQVAEGRSFVITRHGRPVARLVPVGPSPGRAEAVAALRELGAEQDLGGLALRELIDQGRP